MTAIGFAPKWNAPSSVRALFCMRGGGVSVAPFASLNMSATCGDDINAVRENRRRLALHLPAAAKWLRQSHTAKILCAEDIKDDDSAMADGVYAAESKVICAITIADCVPVLLCTADGAAVSAVHCGWRGLAAGIIANAAAALCAISSAPLVAWIGPAICARHYPVGAEVRAACCQSKADEDCFINCGGGNDNGGDKFYADMVSLARRRLLAAGAQSITESGECTCQNRRDYFSARRDGNKTGRMATVIWRQ